ncbi:hypothetical protein M758_11G121600 [Ceratodon purpureus]|nr:hypothetical protein M758_11G121600 [Ceratodon purpureus]
MAKDKDKAKNSGEVVSPWTDDSGPDILEIVNDPKNRDQLSPANLGELLTKCPVYQLENAWKIIGSPCKFPPTPDEISKNTWMRQWTPISFKDIYKRSYHRYHPVLMETGTKLFYVVSFDPGTLNKDMGYNWIALPPLNFLPPGCERVIAGSAGLVVMDGGEQPGSGPIMLWGQMQVPNAKFWQNGKFKKQFGGQSLVCVANPLTREFILLPPIPNRRVHDKIAKFVFGDMERSKYYLVIAGWDTIKRKKQNKLVDILCVIVYSSEKQGFVHANYIEKARPIPFHECGRSGMAIINYGVYFGGQRVIERVDDEENCVPAIYYFNISDSRRQCLCFDFNLVNMAGREIQAPKVVQAGPDRVFAITRFAQLPTIIWMVEVELHPDGTPTGSYRKIHCGVMPGHFYELLFPTEDEALLPYECTSADGVIAIKVYSERNLMVSYHIDKREWRLFKFPHHQDQKIFQLCDGCYEPVFTARP